MLTIVASAHDQGRSEGIGVTFAAARTRLGLVALLLLLAGVGWWWTVDQMHGMDDGPWTSLGTVGWFLGVWVVMMAAMMLPSVAPTVALFSSLRGRQSDVGGWLFTVGYLVVWTATGALAFAVALGGGRIAGDLLSWDRAGRWVAAATLAVAALYELTPLKDVCLGKCRSPLGMLLGPGRDGPSGALRTGARNGAWCVGCCWALMLSFFALGIMSVVWMAVVAGLIAMEKTLPWRRIATYGTAAVLLTLGLLVLTTPGSVPGLTIPGGGGSMSQMDEMSP